MSFEEALKEILHKDLKEIQENMYKLSCELGIKNIMIEMEINGDKFKGRGFAGKLDKIDEIEQNKNCLSYLENIYTSRFSIEDGYSIHFGDLIKERKIDKKGLEDIISKIEFRSMEIHEITIYLYLRHLYLGPDLNHDSYKRVRIYFSRKIDCNEYEEMDNKFKESHFFGNSSSKKTKISEPISFKYTEIDEQYEYPKDHRFLYMIYKDK